MLLRPFYKVSPTDWLATNNPDVAAAQARALANSSLDETSIEEYVRQWVLKELTEIYGYPAEWLGERIVVEERVQMATMFKEADISIKNERHKTFLYVETKNAGSTKAEFDAAEAQLMGYLSSTHTATVGMVTNGRTTRCLIKKINPNDFDYIPDIPEYDQRGLRQSTKLAREITPDMLRRGVKTGLTPITEKFEDILYRCHSAIRDVDGAHADEALDELSKIIYAKIYDERQVVDSAIGTSFRFQTYGAGNTEEVASNIRELYREASDKDITVYSQRIPNYERSRGVFRQEIGLSSNALVKCVDVLQHYSFLDSTGDIKGRAFQRVLGPAIRAGMGQYFTPDEVVNLIVDFVSPSVKDLILDPFCGSAHFLTRCMAAVEGEHRAGVVSDYSFHQFKFFHLHGIEKSERMVRIAMCDMALQDDGHTNIRCADALLSFDNYPDIKALGGEDNADPQVFDIILTNPPFGSLMGGEIGNIIKRFDLGKSRKTAPLEILGLERCLQFLKPGGRMAIVLQDGVLTDTGHSYVRNWLHTQAEIVAVVSLPGHTFTPFGASPKTSVLFLRKFEKGRQAPSGKPVFFARLDDIGYAATGHRQGTYEGADIVRAFHRERGW